VTTRNATASTLLALAALACGSCASDPRQGYAQASAHDATIRTVSVPIFENPTFARGLEVELTDAIVKEIQRSTPWRVTREQGANTTLVGTLTDSRLRRLSTQRDSGYVQEVAVELTVDFEFKDNRSGKTLVSRRSFTASDAFVPARPAGERLEAGQHAAVQRLARDIVAELRSAW
jgi:hypothetical protein